MEGKDVNNSDLIDTGIASLREEQVYFLHIIFLLCMFN